MAHCPLKEGQQAQTLPTVCSLPKHEKIKGEETGRDAVTIREEAKT
jgi:hypothetical protein